MRNNGAGDLTVGAGGPFTIATSQSTGAAYNVTVATQPANPQQTCMVTAGTGTVASADVTGITVTCSTNTHVIGGTVSGLVGAGLVLHLNGASPLAVVATGGFAFANPVPSGGAFVITVATQPSNPAQTCSVGASTGTVTTADIGSVVVTCTTDAGVVGGTVTGLMGTSLELSLEGGDSLTLNRIGAFTFRTTLSLGTQYSVTVARQPVGPRQNCTLQSASGAVSSATANAVIVECSLRSGNLRNLLPPPTYPAGSAELATYSSINTARSSGGFGALLQVPALDTAARAHANYLATRFYAAQRFDPATLSAVTSDGPIAAHVEQAGITGFTGVLAADRARTAGYNWIDGAEATVFNVGLAGTDCSDQILDSIVTKARLLNTEMRDIGVGIASTADGQGFVCVVLASYADFRGEAPGGAVAIYPGDGATAVSIAAASDVTGDRFGKNRGIPVLLMADRDAPLNVTLTMRKSGSAQVIASTTVTDSNLPSELTSNQAILVPTVYLEANTIYSIRAVGNVEGIPLDRTTQFTTGQSSHSAAFPASATNGVVRAVYAVPTDRPNNPGYLAAVAQALFHLQGWYQQQLGGETFGVFKPEPEVCNLPHDSAYYVSDTWTKVQTDLQPCAPVRFSDPNYNWVVYADVTHGCNLPGRLGAGTDTLTMLPRADLEGLVGRDTGIDDCGNTFSIFGTLRFIGGLGHELGHAFNLPHPPGCDVGLSTCDGGSIMWQGVYSYPVGYFTDDERSALKAHRFINRQRFVR